MSQFKRSINTLPISQAHKTKMMKNGYTTVADIQAASATELSRDLGLSLEDATLIIAASHPQPQSQMPPPQSALPSASQRAHITIGGSQTAAALLRIPASATALSLGVKGIDELLDGGALKGCLLEISGVPGSGRSAAAMGVFASATKAGHEVLVVGELFFVCVIVLFASY
jgi:RAD51-like protein 2